MIVAERERLTAELGALGLEAAPSKANFILVKAGPEEADVLRDRLLARSIAVRRCSATWPELRDRIRVTVGTREENDALLGALDTELRRLRRRPSSI